MGAHLPPVSEAAARGTVAAEWPSALSPRSEALTLAAIALVALGLRVLVAWRTPVIFDDGPDFIAIARAMARGDFGGALAHPFHPLYSGLIWLTPGSSGHEELAGVTWAVVAGTASVVLLWWLVRPFFGGRVALVAAALLCAHPYAVRISADVQSDTVHLAFFLLGLGLLQRGLARADVGLAFAAGITTALAYLARPEGIGVLIVGAVLVAGEWVQARWRAGRVLAFGASLVGGFALLAVPYMRVIQVVSGEWQLTQKKSLPTLLGVGHLTGSTAALATAIVLVIAGVCLVAWMRRRRSVAWGGPSVRSTAAGRLVAVIILALAVAALISPAALLRWLALFASTVRPELAILVLVGLVADVRTGSVPAGRSFFLGTAATVHGVATFALLVSAGYLSRRHLLPLAVLLLGHAALGLDVAAAAFAARWPGRSPSLARRRATALLLLLVVAIALPKTLRAYREEAVAAMVAGEWVREAAAPGDRIATERSRTAYYAGLVWVPIHDAGGLIDGEALRRLGVRWVVAGKRELTTPDGRTLAVEPAPGQRFEPVYEVERHGFRAVVFEVHEPGG